MAQLQELQAENAALKAKIAELEGQMLEQRVRPKIETMSAEVVDSNPYR
jgi:cell division protein FtsB